MQDSILTSLKKLLGYGEECTSYDTDLIIHINTIFSVLHQLGVGTSEPFVIKDKTNLWSEFTDNSVYLESVKTYMYLKLRLIFDPPQSSAAVEQMNKTVDELEWRLTNPTK